MESFPSSIYFIHQIDEASFFSSSLPFLDHQQLQPIPLSMKQHLMNTNKSEII
jgi:hypothetical protein